MSPLSVRAAVSTNFYQTQCKYSSFKSVTNSVTEFRGQVFVSGPAASDCVRWDQISAALQLNDLLSSDSHNQTITVDWLSMLSCCICFTSMSACDLMNPDNAAPRKPSSQSKHSISIKLGFVVGNNMNTSQKRSRTLSSLLLMMRCAFSPQIQKRHQTCPWFRKVSEN